jgi:hypothetical protein
MLVETDYIENDQNAYSKTVQTNGLSGHGAICSQRTDVGGQRAEDLGDWIYLPVKFSIIRFFIDE